VQQFSAFNPLVENSGWSDFPLLRRNHSPNAYDSNSGLSETCRNCRHTSDYLSGVVRQHMYHLYPAYLIFVLWSAIANGELPPEYSMYREHFDSNCEKMVELELRLAESKFDNITRFGDDMAEGWFLIGEERVNEFLDPGNEWRNLLDAAQLYSVSQKSDWYLFSFGVSPFSGKRDGFFAYIHSSTNVDAISSCTPRIVVARTGRCVVELDANWWSYYEWYSIE